MIVSKLIARLWPQFHVSIGIAYSYAGLLETVLSNAMPLVAGPLVWGHCVEPVHARVWAIYLATRVWETHDAHSGYDLPMPLRWPPGSRGPMPRVPSPSTPRPRGWTR